MEKMKNVIKKGNIKVHLIWFDSLGAKSSSIFVETPDIKLLVDGKQFSIGKTKIRFTFPHYHGIEYDRVGWVIGLIVEYDGKKLIYSSDIEGPQIEDYAEEIIRENPDILILDGFPTYLFGKMINRINMERAKNNIIRIVYGVKAHCVIIYDHHILREEKYKERFKEVYKKTGKKLMTATEYMGEQ